MWLFCFLHWIGMTNLSDEQFDAVLRRLNNKETTT